MKLAEPRYTPKQVEAFTGFDPAMIRLWRSRGQFDFGTLQDNGRWLFSARELLEIALVNILAVSRHEREHLKKLAAGIVPAILASLQFDGYEGGAYGVYFIEHEQDEIWIELTDNPRTIHNYEAMIVSLIDVGVVSNNLEPELLNELLKFRDSYNKALKEWREAT